MTTPTLHPGTGRISAALAGLAALVFAHVAAAASLDTTAQALNLITTTADKICNVVSTKGEANSSDVQGQVKAQLTGLAAKLTDAGIFGSGSITNEEYQNVLRKDLAATIHDNAECKLKVFQTLQTKLLPEKMQTPTQPNHAPQSTEPNTLIAWRDDLSFWISGASLLGVVIRGTVTSTEPVQLTDAYIISEITGEKKTLKAEIAPGPKLESISDINEIPKNALLQLWATFSPGISATDFIVHWGGFIFHAECSGAKYDKEFSRATVESFTRMQFPEIGPHVTPKR